MLLTGTFRRSLDQKNRVAIPKRLRDALEIASHPVVYLAPGTDRSLALYAESAFSQLAARLGDRPPTEPGIRAFSRLFYAQAQCAEVDRQGRVRIPPELAALADLEKEIVMLGVRDHVEMWDPLRWEQYFEGTQPFYDQIAESAFDDRRSGVVMRPRDENPQPGPVSPRPK